MENKEIAPVQQWFETAMSFEGTVPPEDAKEVERVTTEHATYIFYKATSGNVYYSTEADLKFEGEMSKAIAKRKKRSCPTGIEQLGE